MNAHPRPPRRNVPPETLARQAEAADPQNSVWVSANAGAGKTHVLAQRVTRLLLGGTAPSKILCLTYTRAAAANMSNRVFNQLADWAMAPDAVLAEKITSLEGRAPSGKTLARARQLFAEALETPGGLKIQTIHAFCESVLHQFPLEANIAAHFSMLDAGMEAVLVAEARRHVITRSLPAAADEALAEAFGLIVECGGEAGLEYLLKEVIGKRDNLRAFIDQLERSAAESMFAAFDVMPDADAAGLSQALWPDRYFTRELAGSFLARAADAKKKHALSFAESLIAACSEIEADKRLDHLKRAFLTEGGAARKPEPIASKGVGEHFPDFAAEFMRVAEGILALTDRLALLHMLKGTQAALHLADRLLHRYEKAKSGRGFLDFNDLITRTARLLARPDAGPWVQYKLDQGIDHILLDEAQDTSPDQWTVVRRLAEEFFAGVGARENTHRTLFAVGDEKQSIYSFQGAEPQSFTDTRDLFAEKATASERRFSKVELKWSFRSTGDVLSAVDHVFASDAAKRGLTRYPEPIDHKPVRDREGGYVELWPSIGAEDVEEPDDWTKAIDHASAPEVKLAENIAETIRRWVVGRDMLERGEDSRAITAGDVLVLVRKRDRFVHALSRSLKNRNIAVAGADRISLPAHIAVKDLIALGRYILQPEDDLSLAALLRSPVFAVSEEGLFALAASRAPGQSLGSALRAAASGDLSLATIAAQLAAWTNEAAFRPVFEFYAGVLNRDGVRKKMIARLGHEAGEILDEFMSFCLNAEKAGQAGLQAFLATLEQAAPDIRREMDQNRPEVRIMTVHAAKGLEAPVVFLVDGGSAPFSSQHMPRLLSFDPPGNGKDRPWTGKGFLWRFSKQAENEFTRKIGQEVKDRADDEYRRLLYVGMTRAEDRLIVCGYHGKAKQGENCWHAIVDRGLAHSPHASKRQCPHTGQTVDRFRVSPEAVVQPAASGSAEVQPVAEKRLPPNLFAELPAPPPLPRPLAPSGALASVEPDAGGTVIAGRSPVLDAEPGPGLAIARGLAFHRLIEVLPDLPEDERLPAAERYLARMVAAWPASEREKLAATVKTLLAAPELKSLWGPNTRAEVAVTGIVVVKGMPRAVSGKIDRLAVTDAEVLIVDFKTNRPAPRNLDEVPEEHLAQLALYRALLQPLYPDRAVRATLVYTEAGRSISVSEERMDAALAKIGAEDAVA